MPHAACLDRLRCWAYCDAWKVSMLTLTHVPDGAQCRVPLLASACGCAAGKGCCCEYVHAQGQLPAGSWQQHVSQGAGVEVMKLVEP